MKKPKQLLGPDGKPLDVAKYRPAPKPATITLSAAKASEPREIGIGFGSYFRDAILSFDFGFTPAKATQRQKVSEGITLAAAAKRDIAALQRKAPREWKGHAEAPPPPPELTDTYNVAFASARKNCEHKSSTSTLHARRERQCDDCGAYFTRKEWWES